MTLRVRYAPLALAHLNAIYAYVGERSPAAAEDIISRIRRSIGILQEFPNAGRQATRRGTRELRVPRSRYVIVHRLEPRDNSLIVLGVYHTAQRRPGRRM